MITIFIIINPHCKYEENIFVCYWKWCSVINTQRLCIRPVCYSASHQQVAVGNHDLPVCALCR